MSCRPRSRGQSTPIVAIVLLLAALLLVPVAMLARGTIDRARAQAAADAAALAAAGADPGDAEAAARRFATANDARLVAFDHQGAIVEVTVVVDGRRATARAERREVLERASPGPP